MQYLGLHVKACWSRLAGAAYLTREVTLGSLLGQP